MSRARVAKYLLSAALLGAIAYFFQRSFRENWQSVRQHQFRLDYPALALCTLGLVGSYLLATLAWHRTLNAMSGQKLRFGQSVAAVNSSNLAKYLPGKVWALALQLYWLSSVGVSKALVTYVNVVNLAVSVVTTLAFGVFLLLFRPDKLSFGYALALLLTLLTVDLTCVGFHGRLLRWLAALLSRVFKRKLEAFEPTPRVWAEMHALHASGALMFGASAYCASVGVGHALTFDDGLLVMAALLLADVAGFLAVFAPGGLGVREGLMYVMLAGSAGGALALTVPLALRLLNMLVDLGLGGLAFHFSRDFDRAKPGPTPPPQEIAT
ncbi:MAG: lysylphosphatidylglycerol synthase domain-containing protein [Polyangiaceae bacterium]